MARPHPVLVDLAADRPTTQPADLDRLLQSAIEHHMTGLLWSRVRGGELYGPSEWKEELARHDVLAVARNRRIWAALASIRGRLEALGVEFAVIKGVPSEARWYDRMGERPSRDLDLWLSPADGHRVAEIVAALDPANPFRQSVPEIFDRGIVQSLDLAVDGVGVDLHVDLFKLGPPVRDPDLLWGHTTPFGLPDGSTVRVLDPELSLAKFLVHLHKDAFCWLLGFADVARVVGRDRVDWDVLARLAGDAGVDAVVWNGFGAVAETLDLPRPPHRARGWRSRLWQVVWPPAVRLQGDLGWMRHRHRLYWLPVVSESSLGPTLHWARGQLTLSPGLIAQVGSHQRGPWWWRLVRDRWNRMVERRRAVGRLRQGP